jgi:hypothetical protein
MCEIALPSDFLRPAFSCTAMSRVPEQHIYSHCVHSSIRVKTKYREQTLYVSTMSEPAKCILWSDITGCLNEGGIDLLLRQLVHGKSNINTVAS